MTGSLSSAFTQSLFHDKADLHLEQGRYFTVLAMSI